MTMIYVMNVIETGLISLKINRGQVGAGIRGIYLLFFYYFFGCACDQKPLQFIRYIELKI